MAKQEKERDVRQPSLKEQIEASRRINRNINGEDAPDDEGEELPISKMKVADLRAALDVAGVAYEGDANKARLVELLTEHRAK